MSELSYFNYFFGIFPAANRFGDFITTVAMEFVLFDTEESNGITNQEVTLHVIREIIT